MEDELKILIVDDDLVDRMLIKRSLKSAGMTVTCTEAENCTQTLQILEHQSVEPNAAPTHCQTAYGCLCGNVGRW